MINYKSNYFFDFLYHGDMPNYDIFDSHMLASVQEVSIRYLFLSHRCKRSVGHVAERALDTYLNYDF